MKNLLPFLFILLTIAACRDSGNDEARNIQLLADSSVYTNNSVYSDTIAGMQHDQTSNSEPEQTPAPQSAKEKVIVKYVPVKTVVVEKQQVPAAQPPITTTPNTTSKNDSATVNAGNKVPDAGTPGDVVKEEKKGWSKAAQGAVIGGVAGAVGGAIISKKKGVGAVVGGIVGAAGGYILGKKKDKKDSTKN